MIDSFIKLDYTTIEKTVKEDFFNKTRKLLKKFEEKDPVDENAVQIATELKQDIDSFRENMWIIELLTTEAMKNVKKSKGHWEDIFERTDCVVGDKKGKDIEVGDELSLEKLISNIFIDQ